MRIIKATYGPSESGTTGTVIGGTIVGGTVIDTEGVERPPQPPGPSATAGGARPGDDPAAGHPGSAASLTATSTCGGPPSATPPR